MQGYPLNPMDKQQTAVLGGFAGQMLGERVNKSQESPCDQALKKIHAAIARLTGANGTLNSRISKVVPQLLAGEADAAKMSAPEPGTSSLITELFSIARLIDQQASAVEYLNDRIEL